VRRRSPLRADGRRGPGRVHRCPRAHQPRLRPELDPLRRGLPRPLRAAHLPHRLPDVDPVDRDAHPQPLPHRLLPAPPPRPHDQRLLRPGPGGRAPRPALDGGGFARVTAPVSARERAWLSLLLIAPAVVVRLSSGSAAAGGGGHVMAALSALCWLAGLLLVHETVRAFVSAEGAFWAVALIRYA